MEKQKNIPALRFTEFYGEWKNNKLGEITEKIQDGTHFSPVVIEEGHYKYITSKNIRNGYMDLTDISYISDTAHREIYRRCDVRLNDVLITKDGASVGNVCLNELNEEFSLLSSVAVIRANRAISQNDYIYQYIVSPIGQKEIQSFVSGQAITRITLTKLKCFNISFPTLPEQQKIASFLTSVDTNLTQLKQKKNLLEQYKKGVMQKIFSREIRFKDDEGKEFPEWVEKKFGDIYSFYPTNSYSRENLNYENGEVKNIHYGDIHTKFQPLFDIRHESVPFINSNISLVKLTTRNYCKAGDLIIADASEDYADIGKCIEIVNLDNQKVVAGLHTLQARPDLYVMSLGFGTFLMKSSSVRLQLMTIAQGSKVLSITAGRLSGMAVSIPCLEEQTKIANFLSALDEKINHCKTQIEKTEQWKKGLLQKMFV